MTPVMPTPYGTVRRLRSLLCWGWSPEVIEQATGPPATAIELALSSRRGMIPHVAVAPAGGEVIAQLAPAAPALVREPVMAPGPQDWKDDVEATPAETAPNGHHAGQDMSDHPWGQS